MSDRGPVIYGLESQGRALTARSLAARSGDTENIQFVVGTQSLRHENQVHVLEYSDETGVLDKTVYIHSAGEIWDLNCAPFDGSLLSTCYGCLVDSKVTSCCALWRLTEEAGDTTPLQHVTNVELGGHPVRCTAWHPSSSPQMVTIDNKNISLIKLAGDKAKIHCSAELEDKGRSSYSALSWNPHHHSSVVLFSMDAAIKAWDTRAAKFPFGLEAPHGPCVRDMDFNPNRPHYFVSCGDDCTVKFWDSRRLTSPLATTQDHSHWVWSVQYNLFHDQLLLTASSDSQVVLARMASLASEPLHHLDDEMDRPPVLKDEVIATFEEHEDSVYNAVWSVADAWVFASLSFDGRVVVNHVPSQEKFSILTS